ncbi:MAG: sugar transferase [Kofleriaceae bacterium]
MSLAQRVKRTFDVTLAGGGLVLGAPVMLAIAAAIHVDSRGGVFYVQERLGRGGRTFKLLKFRTMKPAPIQYNPDGSTRVEPGDARVTRVGRFLRGALDELPQLWNVLRGDMSLIGPRPDMATQRALYEPGEERKLNALPGITGLSVVVGRNVVSWKERVAIDIKYVERWSLALDLKILAQTMLMPLGLKAFDFEDELA